MKRLLLATTAWLLIVPDIALAAQAQPERRPAPGQPRPQTRPQTGPARPGGPQVQPPRPGTGGPQIQPPRPGRPQPPRPQPPRPQPPRPQPPRPQPPRPGGPQIQPPRPGTGIVRPPRPPVRPRPPRPPHRPGAGRPPIFRPIHGPIFHYPRGYRYRRWVIGVLLPRLFLSNSYYYDNWYDLGLGAPPPGTRWVRYGPDLLLVRGRDARILDVIYGAFN